MAYGPKYSFDFETTNGTGIQILILEKDRSGLPVTRALGRAPILKREKSGCMHGTSIEIHAECKVDREFAQLYTSSADQFKVEVWKKPASGPIIRAKIWEGFVSPELYSEPDIAPPYDVQIIATDGLGELKNYRFEAAGRKTVMEHVKSLLSHTGLDITIDVVSSLQYDSQGGFMNAVVSLDHMKGESCYDVLKALLESFHASITLQDGMWKVWRETDLATLSGQVEVAEFGSISSADWWPVGQLSTVIVPAENEVTLISENAYKDNVLKNVAWQITGDATFNEDEQAYVLGGITSMVSKYISFRAEVGYKLTLAVKARNVGSRDNKQDIGIKIQIDSVTASGNYPMWLRYAVTDQGEGYYGWNYDEEGFVIPLSASDADAVDTLTVEIPLYDNRKQGVSTRSWIYAKDIKITLYNSSGKNTVYVYDIALVKTQQAKGYKSVVQIANGARESAEETTLILADSDRIPAAAEVFMDGIPLNADGAPVSQWSSARVTGHGYLSFMSRDYALSHALPRMKVVGVLNVPASALVTPMLYRRDNTYYFPETYDYDLLNDEISVNLVSIPTATISVSSEEVTEIVQEGASIGITSGGGGGGGSSAPTGDFVTKDELIAEIGEAYPIYLAQENDEQKEANRAAIAAYVAAEVKPILYPYGETRATVPFSVTTHEMEDGIEAIIQYRVGLAVEPTMGEAYYLITAKVNKDGSVEIQNDAPAEYILPAEEYVKEMIGESYPVYTPLDGQELTEEQKAANKEAYDALVAAYGGSHVPHLYAYDIGKMFPIVPYEVYADEGYAELFLNINAMQMSLSDIGLSGSALATIGEHFYLHSDGSVTSVASNMFLSPDYLTLMELAQKGGGSNITETDPVFKASPAAAITQADITRWNSNTGGGGSVTVDSAMSETSTNPVQNKVITKAISDIEERVSNMEDFFGEGANLTLSIKSNQGTDETISAVKATIKYDGQSMESGSGIIGLPAFASIQIIFPDIEGYKTPAPISFDTNGHPVSYSVTYETEVVNVNLSAWDGASVNGQIVTINGKNYTWDGNDIQHKVAFGVEYWVYASDKSGYVIKGDKFVASQTNRTVSLVYNGVSGSFITIDQNIADSATRVSGDINGEHIQLIRNNSHRYLGKYTSDGTMTLCQLDDDDSHYYGDGSEAVLTGSQGDVFMKLPRFFYTVNERRPDVWSIGFYYGNSAPSSAWVEWDGNELIGVFKSNAYARSIAVDSNYGLSKDTYSSRASARGNGYSLIKWKHHGIMTVLYFALYGNTNSQAVIGEGLGPARRQNGSTSSLGMTDTVASEDAINFWGLENWWGAGYEFFENVIFLYDTRTWKIVEDDGTIRERKARTYSSYLGKCYIDTYLDFGIERPDSTATYSDTTGYCDTVSHYMASANERVVERGDNVVGYMGILAMHTTLASSTATTGNYEGGSRICFRGTIIINNDSTAFKALTAIN